MDHDFAVQMNRSYGWGIQYLYVLVDFASILMLNHVIKVNSSSFLKNICVLGIILLGLFFIVESCVSSRMAYYSMWIMSLCTIYFPSPINLTASKLCQLYESYVHILLWVFSFSENLPAGFLKFLHDTSALFFVVTFWREIVSLSRGLHIEPEYFFNIVDLPYAYVSKKYTVKYLGPDLGKLVTNYLFQTVVHWPFVALVSLTFLLYKTFAHRRWPMDLFIVAIFLYQRRKHGSFFQNPVIRNHFKQLIVVVAIVVYLGLTVRGLVDLEVIPKPKNVFMKGN